MSDTMHPSRWHDDAAPQPPPPPAPPPSPRARWQAATIAVLSFLLVAAVGSLIAQRVMGSSGGEGVAQLESRLALVQEERDSLRTANEACRRSAAIATVFIADFEEWRQLDAAWWVSEEGSAEEAELDVALEAAMSSLRDTAADLKAAALSCRGEE